MNPIAGDPKPRLVLRYTLAGAVFGSLFPLGAWALDIAIRDAEWSLAGIRHVHLANPLHWIIDSVPFVLAVFASQIGKYRWRQEILRESEIRYRTLVEQLPAITYIAALDEAKTTLYVSPQIETILGFSQAQWLTDPDLWRRQLHPDDRERVLAEATRFYTGGEPFRSEYRMLARDGRAVWLHDEAIVARDPAGQPRFIQGVRRDITEHKQAGEALRASEARLRTALENMPVMLDALDDRNNIIVWNRECERVTGYSAQEILSHPSVAELLYPDPAYRERQQAALGASGDDYRDWEWVTTCKDGSARIIAWSNISGRFPIPGWARWGIGVDITERKQAEQALREANEKLTRWLAEQEQRTREMALLNEMGGLLQACVTADEAYEVIARLMQQLFPGERGGLYAISASRNVVDAIAVWGDPPPAGQAFTPNDCWALRRGKMHVVEASHPALPCPHLSDSPPAYLCVPMMAQGEALGVLHLQSSAGGGESLTKAKQQLSQTVADSIGLALANVNLRESLRRQSIRDPLTGLFNRRYLEETLEREVHRAARDKRPVGIIMLDLDHFKRFNDAFGHAAGDRLLHELGSFLQQSIRGGDIACRYGGEEFTLILPGASLEVTQQRAEHLRTEVKRLDAQQRDPVLGRVTLSLGVAVFPDHGHTGGAALGAADEALYRAKRGGRDQVVIAQ